MKRSDWPANVRYGKEPLLANFRQSVTERHQALKAPAAWQKRSGMSEAHLELIRKLPCTVCPALSRSDPHHLKSGPAHKERGFGMRSTDKHAVPICRFHHDEVERAGARGEEAWFAKWGLDPHALANALWNSTGDLAQMGLILIAHKQAAIRALRKIAVVNVLVAHGMTRDEAEQQYATDQHARRRA